MSHRLAVAQTDLRILQDICESKNPVIPLSKLVFSLDPENDRVCAYEVDLTADGVLIATFVEGGAWIEE